MDSVSKRIDLLLNEKEMSRRQLAASMKVPPSTFQSAMERDSFSADLLSKVANALGVTTSYLLGGEEYLALGWQKSIHDIFFERLGDLLAEVDSADMEEVFGTTRPYDDLWEGRVPLTLERATEIADECGVTLDYLVGNTDDPYESFQSPYENDIGPQEKQQMNDLNVAFLSMNATGQQKAVENVQDLAKVPEYQKEPPEGSKRPEKGKNE